MDKEAAIKLFNNKKIRVEWVQKEEKWYFSVVDVVGVLSESENSNNYWKVLKNRLKKEGSELVTKCNQLRLQSSDGKLYMTDVLDTEGILRLVQAIPSPKAEPFKVWLAKVGSERIDETADPELAINRALSTYLKKGYSKEWINQRLKSIDVRKELTDEWENRGVKKGQEFAILTDEITQAWSGYKTGEYKQLKNLKRENLRDNMTNLELVLNMLAEVTTTELSKEKEPQNIEENIVIAKQGGGVAGNARKEIEKMTGNNVVTSKNAKEIRKIGQ
ncbi:MAG TPA: hypothetical protein DCP90_03830 [Clostridiales bacterium]|nr:MAG: antirepressor [Clostridiales bacterium GWD2_32_59]HAN09725.1 hypothetical protein [Clostridiales bacterium]